MAEFASAILNLLVFSAQVSDSLYSLIHALKDASHEILALSDEMTDFRAIVLRLADANKPKECGDGG